MENTSRVRVILVGAGFISGVHASVLTTSDSARLVAVVDANIDAAKALSAQHGNVPVYDSVGAAIAECEFDAAHVLVPPDKHFVVTHTLLSHGKHVLVEKPLCETVDELDQLDAVARQHNCRLGVNQNFVFHPALTKAQNWIAEQKIGDVKAISLRYEMPLRQLDSKQLNHWMFAKPVNLLLEQAVHPLSQLFTLAGVPNADFTVTGKVEPQLGQRLPLILRVDGIAQCDVPVQVSFAMGQAYPLWNIEILGQDGAISLDMVNNRAILQTRSPFLPAMDNALRAIKTSGQYLGQGVRDLWNYTLQICGVGKNRAPFYLSMKGSIDHFYAALTTGRTHSNNATFARDLIAQCHQWCNDIVKTDYPDTPTPNNDALFDVLVIGGTGFIGQHVVQQLADAGLSVGVMARNLNALPDLYFRNGISLIAGNVKRNEDINLAVSRARYVINLAHGGGGRNFDEIREAMVGSARTVALACRNHGIKRLVHVGSIASLYLGNSEETITSQTLPDPYKERRADYSRAKAETDLCLLHDFVDIDWVLLRPGVVVGKGGLINHTGIGFFNNEQYFLGWNLGRNPLPFVLADDVATAIIQALDAEGVRGKTLNLVGDVRLNAKTYVGLLARNLHRPFRYVPQPTIMLFAIEIAKWLVKRVAGGKAARPTFYDLRSRSMPCRFDTAEEKALLNWSPVSKENAFVDKAIKVHRTEQNT